MALDMQLNVQYIWSSGKSEGKNSSKMVKALPTNPQKWLMLDVSDLRNGWWYINFALFSTSYWETMQEQTFGDSKGQLCMSWVVQTNVTRHILFIYTFYCINFSLSLFLAGNVLAIMLQKTRTKEIVESTLVELLERPIQVVKLSFGFL